MFLTLMLAAGEVAAKAGEVAAAAAGGEEQTSGLHNFLEILTKPDNIPIVAMFFIVFYFFGLSMKMGAANDKLTQSGEKEKIYERMNRWAFGATDEETK